MTELVNQLSESLPWRSKKFLFAMSALVLIAAMFVTSRLTGGAADVERDLLLVLGALVTFFLGGQSFVDSRKATVIGRLMPQPKGEPKQ